MHDIRLLALDLDGTLMGHDATISEANLQALHECLARGIRVYAVSGRPYSFARMIADRVSPTMGVVAANGALYEINGHEIERPIAKAALHTVIDMAQNDGVSLFLKGRQTYYANVPYDERFLYDAQNPYFRKDLQVVSHVNQSVQQLKARAENILKILAYHESAEHMQRFRRRLSAMNIVTITDYRPISFDITAKAVDKGSALSALCQSLHISTKQVLACGDADNDFAMFAAAGYSVAMSNAERKVQERCDYVVNNEDGCGVARAVRKLVLSPSDSNL